MLELINDERVKVGLDPVVLGDNVAAQLHAEAEVENCFGSHWGMDGLKPYMRYSLAGGFQSNGENLSGLPYCVKASEGFRVIGSVEPEISLAMERLMGSPGHRDNILDPWRKRVNIGLAWDDYSLQVVQHFEGDYVEYAQLPVINRGVLSMSGSTKNGAVFVDELDLGVLLTFDPPPHRLTAGQVARAYSYDNGLLVVALRPPIRTANQFYKDHQFTYTYTPSLNPYDVPADAEHPSSYDEARLLWEWVQSEHLGLEPRTIEVPWNTALEWTARGTEFSIAADLWDVLGEHGKGVYTLLVWGTVSGEDVLISQYSIFHDLTPPDTYTPS